MSEYIPCEQCGEILYPGDDNCRTCEVIKTRDTYKRLFEQACDALEFYADRNNWATEEITETSIAIKRGMPKDVVYSECIASRVYAGKTAREFVNRDEVKKARGRVSATKK